MQFFFPGMDDGHPQSTSASSATGSVGDANLDSKVSKMAMKFWYISRHLAIFLNDCPIIQK